MLLKALRAALDRQEQMLQELLVSERFELAGQGRTRQVGKGAGDVGQGRAELGGWARPEQRWGAGEGRGPSTCT